MQEVLEQVMGPRDAYRGMVSATGSAGTIASGDHLKNLFPGSKIAASEAQQCPTLLENGFGAHRIEGIGDKHVPWIHNVRNTDLVIAVDDADCMNLLRLFNEPAGREYLADRGVPRAVIQELPLIGISGMGNILAAIKLARYFECREGDLILTVLTDSMQLYGSRVAELARSEGPFDRDAAVRASAASLAGQRTDNLLELSYPDRKRVHNLKYYTWVEQQGKTAEELSAQWYDPSYWKDRQERAQGLDVLIEEFNREVGAL
jgi:hypothetical protein